MHITHTHILSSSEKETLLQLTDQCRRAENLTLSFPVDADDFWIMSDEDGNTCACFAACKIDGGLWECYAFTQPDRRGRGYFSLLLEQVCHYSQNQGDPVLAFVTDERCPQALAVLEHMEANFSHREYIMSFPLSSCSETREPVRNMKLKFEKSELDTNGEGAEGVQYIVTASSGNGGEDSDLPLITCRLILQGSKIYLFSLETLPQYRRRGIAYGFLIRLIGELAKSSCDTLCLHVSGANEGALKLYKKTGFRITEALSYYLY